MPQYNAWIWKKYWSQTLLCHCLYSYSINQQNRQAVLGLLRKCPLPNILLYKNTIKKIPHKLLCHLLKVSLNLSMTKTTLSKWCQLVQQKVSNLHKSKSSQSVFCHFHHLRTDCQQTQGEFSCLMQDTQSMKFPRVKFLKPSQVPSKGV